MELLWEIVQFVFFSGLIVFISKKVLVKTLRNLAENLSLKPKTVGNIAGIATSVPELLTISVSSFNGLMGASLYNVLSSNIINFIQYILAIILNKNQKFLKNKAIQINIISVLITIILPIFLIILKIHLTHIFVPIFLILYLFFRKINNNAHKLYLRQEDKKIENILKAEDKWERGNKTKAIKNIIILLITGIVLFFIGNLLGDTLEILCNIFNIPEFVVGIILGFVTSIPELITFFESQKHHKGSQNDMIGVIEATNNLLMSNLINLFVIQSIGILISI